MSYPVLFIAVWVLGSGAVAYVGDKIGRRMGKRRLTMFGLRPRHTAAVFTVATGMLIASLTFGAMFLVNRRVTMAVLRIDQLLRGTAELELRYARATNSAQAALVQARHAERARSKAESERRSAIARVQDLRRQIRARQNELARLAGEVDGLRHQLAGTNQRMLASRRELKAVRAILDAEQERLRATERRLWAAEARAAEALRMERDARQAEADAKVRQRQAEELAKSLQSEVDAKTARLSALQSDLQRADSDLRAARDELARTKERLDRVRADLEQAQAFQQWMMEGAAIIRKAPIIFRAEEELARRVVYQPDSPQQVLQDFARLLAVADVVATRRGAAPPGGSGRAVRAVTISIPDAPHDLTEEQQVSLLAQSIAAEKQDVVLRVVAAANTVRGEPVQATLDVKPIRKVFRRGEVIAETVVPPQTPEPRAVEAVLDLLQVKTRVAALERGMLPSPSGTLGEAGWDQVVS
ncbi:MAG: DUF3084 domain-containing protein, partial [Armatimonadota bacterium]